MTVSSTQSDVQDNLSVPQAPKFYTPSDVPSIPPATAAPPPNVGGPNNFRFSSKKKLYAPIPGLSDQTQQSTPVVQPSTFSTPGPYGGSDCNPTSHYQQTPLNSVNSRPIEQKSEERKGASGLFSKISNLAPTGVFQNITGLVQSAADSLTQTVKSESVHNTQFNVSEPSYPTEPPPVTNYFAPVTSYNPPNLTNLETNCFVPQSEAVGDIINQTNVIPPASVFFQNSPAVTTLQTDIPLLNPSNFSQQTSSSTTTAQPSIPPPLSPSQDLADRTLKTSVPVEIFNPTQFVPDNSNSISQISSSGPLPPLKAENIVPPKAGASTSYRLQKGTKLYKNPLTPNETAPVHVTPNQIEDITKTVQPPHLTSYPGPLQSVPLLTSKATEQGQNLSLFVPTPTGELRPTDQGQSVPLSVPSFKVEEKLGDQTQAASYFNNLSTEELKSSEYNQSVSLFAPFKTEQYLSDQQQSITDFIPPPSSVGVQSLNNQNQTSCFFAPPAGNTTVNQPDQSVTSLTPPKSISTEEYQTNQTNQSIPSFSAFAEKQKSIEPTQSLNFISSCKEQSEIISDGLKNIQLDQNISNENLTIEASVPEHQNNYTENQQITEPIEPVIDDQISVVKQIPTEQTVQKLFPSSETTESEILTLPPITVKDGISGNPYRKESTTEISNSAKVQPSLSNFFAPKNTSGLEDFNFFATLSTKESTTPNLQSAINFFSENTQSVKTDVAGPVNFFINEPIQPNTDIQPPITAFFSNISTDADIVSTILENTENRQFIDSLQQPNVSPPIGFENCIQPKSSDCTIHHEEENTTFIRPELTNQIQRPEVVNTFSNYFNQTKNQLEFAKDPSTFFDSFPSQTTQQKESQSQQQHQVEVPTNTSAIATNEEQRIQYFFNNPPPKEADRVGDLNYDLVHSGLGIKNLQQRSLTPVSNLVEPPSSACSEFSELSNSTAGQRSSTANQSVTENSEKLAEKDKDDNRTEILEEQVSTNEDNSSNKNLEDLHKEIFKHYGELSDEVLKELRMANMLSADKSTASLADSVVS